ncbi:Retrovirus-related Pol polyprotein from type-1 retrotransposable element R2 [Eumeta japonica]|uniref:Retrovirus-related Pol polyprotein from type-1 retrotransposable element R2 n=1 Tax=Eumeta variegata TaxID=151549 RepID=A0A4C1XI78_EUMVA|nr:Retrovirus-related Pol polyprotein from type-1 retrotransposable element R2 [Eumeta japonica]
MQLPEDRKHLISAKHTQDRKKLLKRINKEIKRNMRNDKKKDRMETMENYINTEVIPQQWRESNIILLYKKGHKHEIGNYCPISLMSNTYKVFAKIILKRIARTLDEQQPIEIQLKKKGKFKVGKGVGQGDPLSPKLFSAVLESIFRRLNWEGLGINVDGTLLTHLRFADDIVLFAKTPENGMMTLEKWQLQHYFSFLAWKDEDVRCPPKTPPNGKYGYHITAT